MLPTKQRDFQNHHMDSRMWDGFQFRDDDIVIATFAKSGTTWMQQIISQLIFDGEEGLAVADMSPWIDLRIPPKEVKIPAVEQQTHRRFIKTHLPVDCLVFSPKAKYVYIGRDGRDVCWSMYNHHKTANADWFAALNDTPGRVGPPILPAKEDIREYFLDFLAKDGYPFWPFYENIRTWYAIKDLPNVMLIHFNELKNDLPGSMRKLARFLDIPIKEERFQDMLLHCSFDYMKKNSMLSVPLRGIFWDGGSDTFIHKGTNGRWKDILTKEDVEAYEKRTVAELGEECAKWLSGN